MTPFFFTSGFMAAIATWVLPNFFNGTFNPMYVFIAAILYGLVTGIPAGRTITKKIQEGTITPGFGFVLIKVSIVVLQVFIAWIAIELIHRMM